MLARGILSRGAVYAFPVTDLSGTIKRIGFAEAGVGVLTEPWKQPGDVIAGMSSSMDRLGCVVSLAESREAAVRESRKTMAGFYMDVTP